MDTIVIKLNQPKKAKLQGTEYLGIEGSVSQTLINKYLGDE